jgi:glycosyltransferase involved in cell wall biosynthesis
MKIAIVVHGRFYAFDLARELEKMGQDVTLFTNYPKFYAAHYGVSRKNVRSFLLHGILSRTLKDSDWLHRLFENWAEKELMKEDWDLVHIFSGVAEKSFSSLKDKKKKTIRTLARGSAHIRTQSEICLEEEKRSGITKDKPAIWALDKEEKEYKLADTIFVLSSFARQTFIDQKVPEEKLVVLPLGSNWDHFKASEKNIAKRRERVASGKPLNILMTGTFSFQKGISDFAAMADALAGQMKFRFVGAVREEARKLLKNKNIEYIPKQIEFNLRKFYDQADLFVFTTLQDGYAVVLAQAQAAGLPILATSHCSAPDIIENGRTGWVLPIRKPEAFIEQLKWCDAHRRELAEMITRIPHERKAKNWKEVGEDFKSIAEALCSRTQ